MSRIPSKAMPHAYAPEGGNDDGTGGGGGGGEGAGSPTLAERASELAERASELAGKVRGSRAARVAAGAVVAGAAVVAATAVVRSRRGKSDGSGGGTKTPAKKSAPKTKSGTAKTGASGARKPRAKSGGDS